MTPPEAELHDVVLRLRTPPPAASPPPAGDSDLFNRLPFPTPVVELTLDGRSVRGVQSVTVTLSAVDNVPTVVLHLVPGTLVLDLTGPAAVTAAEALSAGATLDGALGPSPGVRDRLGDAGVYAPVLPPGQ